MKKKTFYSILKRNEVMEAVKHNGFQFKKNGIKFYVYENKNEAVFIIDPLTGLSLKGEYCFIEDAPLYITDCEIEEFAERRKTEKYQVQMKMFEALKKAAKVIEECKIMLKGMENNEKK